MLPVTIYLILPWPGQCVATDDMYAWMLATCCILYMYVHVHVHYHFFDFLLLNLAVIEQI